MRDLASNVGVALAIAPAVHTATVAGDPIDLKGAGSAAIVITTGAIAGDGNFTAKVQESDTATPEDFTDVAAGDLVGALPATLAASAVVKQSYIGHKGFVRVVLTKNSGTSIAASAAIVKGNLALRPAA